VKHIIAGPYSSCKICGKRISEMEKHITDEQKVILRKLTDSPAKSGWQSKFESLLTEFHPCLSDKEFMVKDIIE